MNLDWSRGMWLPSYHFSSLAGRLRFAGARCTTDWTHGRNATTMRLARRDGLLCPSAIQFKTLNTISHMVSGWNMFKLCSDVHIYERLVIYYCRFVSNQVQVMMVMGWIISKIHTMCHWKVKSAKLSGRHGLKLKLALWSPSWATAWIASSGTQEFGQKLTWHNKVRTIIIYYVIPSSNWNR